MEGPLISAVTPSDTAPSRDWRTIHQLSDKFPAYSPAAIRTLIQRSRPHYNHRGELVEGNGLAGAISQPGGKNGKIMVDAIAFAAWLEQWTHAPDATQWQYITAA